MRRLTLQEVNEHYGGTLPPDAVLRPDGHEEPPRPAKARGRPRAARFAVLNAFCDFGLAGLTGAETKVWLLLFRDTKATGTARTGQADLAGRSGLSVRAVKQALKGLRRRGLADVVRRGRLNCGPSVYRVHPTGRHGEAYFPLHGAKCGPQLGNYASPIPEWDQYAAAAGAHTAGEPDSALPVCGIKVS